MPKLRPFQPPKPGPARVEPPAGSPVSPDSAERARALGGGGGPGRGARPPGPPLFIKPRRLLVGIPEWVAESDLAIALGLGKSALEKKGRPPWPGAIRQERGRIEYSAEAVGALLVDLGLAERTSDGLMVDADFQLTLPEPAPSDPVVQGVVRKFHLNPKKMTVEVEGRTVELFLKDVRKFRLGMKVPLRRDELGRWQFAGRLPRWPGRY